MKHPSTRAVFAHWNVARGKKHAPERGDIEPGSIRRGLGDTFMLARDEGADDTFRLAGTRVCALFCREMKGQTLLGLFGEPARTRMRELLEIVTQETVGVVAGVRGTCADGAELSLEMLLLPLTHGGSTRARLLGVLAPLDAPYWLGLVPLDRIELGPLRHVGPALESVTAPRLARIPPDSRIQHGFIVHEGGRAGQLPIP